MRALHDDDKIWNERIKQIYGKEFSLTNYLSPRDTHYGAYKRLVRPIFSNHMRDNAYTGSKYGYTPFVDLYIASGDELYDFAKVAIKNNDTLHLASILDTYLNMILILLMRSVNMQIIPLYRFSR